MGAVYQHRGYLQRIVQRITSVWESIYKLLSGKNLTIFIYIHITGVGKWLTTSWLCPIMPDLEAAPANV